MRICNKCGNILNGEPIYVRWYYVSYGYYMEYCPVCQCNYLQNDTTVIILKSKQKEELCAIVGFV